MAVNLINFLDKKFYPSYSTNWDDKYFREYLENYINPNTIILDFGAGAGIVEEMNFRGIAKQVYGVDPDPRVKNNPYLDFAFIGVGEEMNFFKDETFDIVFCDNVFEHVENPIPLLKEVNRVLKKGGILIAKTPNRNHYMPLVARLTPTWFHKFYNKVRGRNETDTFKTYYNLNSLHQQSKLSLKTGFKISEIKCIEGRPEYLRLTVFTYLLGLIYERVVNRFQLNNFKILIISTWIKLPNKES